MTVKIFRLVVIAALTILISVLGVNAYMHKLKQPIFTPEQAKKDFLAAARGPNEIRQVTSVPKFEDPVLLQVVFDDASNRSGSATATTLGVHVGRDELGDIFADALTLRTGTLWLNVDHSGSDRHKQWTSLQSTGDRERTLSVKFMLK